MGGYEYDGIPEISKGSRLKKLLRTPIFWMALAAALLLLWSCQQSYGQEIPETLVKRLMSERPIEVDSARLNENGKTIWLSALLFPPDLIILTFIRYDQKRKSYYWYTNDVQEILRIQPNGKPATIWRKEKKE